MSPLRIKPGISRVQNDYAMGAGSIVYSLYQNLFLKTGNSWLLKYVKMVSKNWDFPKILAFSV